MALSGIIKANLHEKTKNLIDSNKEFEDKIASFSTILTYYSFSEKDVANVIDRICQNGKIKLADQLIELLKENYLDGEIFSANKDRVKSLKRILLETIELYEEDSKNVSSQIKEVLALAKQLNLSPYRIALKTNIRMATVDNFQNTLEALTKEKYNLNKNEESALFSQEEYKQIMQQCASIACRVSADNLKEIIDLLKKLSYDKGLDCYHFDVKSLLKETPSLLAVSVDKMANTIALLEIVCDENKIAKAELLDKISKNPSILMISSEKFNENLDICQKIYFNLSKKMDKNLVLGKFLKSPNNRKLEKSFYNLDNLEAITNSKSETLLLKAELLEKFVGAQNAMNCLLDKAILSSDLTKLGFVLAYIANADNKNKNNHLKTTFVANPSKFLNVLSLQKALNENDDETNNSSGKNREYHKKEENVVDKNFPLISSSELVKTIDSYKTINSELYEKFVASVNSFAGDIQTDKKAKREYYKKLREMNRLSKNPQDNEPSNDKSNSETDTDDTTDNKEGDNTTQKNIDESKEEKTLTIDDIIVGIEEIKREGPKAFYSKVTSDDFAHGVPQYRSIREKTFDAVYTNIANFFNFFISEIKKEKRNFLKSIGSDELCFDMKKLQEVKKAFGRIEGNNACVMYHTIDIVEVNGFELRQWASISMRNETASILNSSIDTIISAYKRNQKQYKSIESLFVEKNKEGWEEFVKRSNITEINHEYHLQQFLILFIIAKMNALKEFFTDEVLKIAFNDPEDMLMPYLNKEQEYDENLNAPDIIKDIEYLRTNNFDSVNVAAASSIFFTKLLETLNNTLKDLSQQKDYKDVLVYSRLQDKNSKINILDVRQYEANLAKTEKYIQEIEDILANKKDSVKLYYGPNLEMYVDLGMTDEDNKPAMALIKPDHTNYYIKPKGEFATIDPRTIHIVKVEFVDPKLK